MVNSLGALLCLQSTMNTPAEIDIYLYMYITSSQGQGKGILSISSCLIHVTYFTLL